MNQDPQTDPEQSDEETEHSATTAANHDTNSQTDENTTLDEIDHTTIMGILCYLGPLVFIPYFTDRSNPVIKFHIKQGLVLLGFGLLPVVFGSLLPFLFLYTGFLQLVFVLFNLFIVVLAVIGIVNVVKREQKTLPVIGDFANKINI